MQVDFLKKSGIGAVTLLEASRLKNIGNVLYSKSEP